MKTITPYPPDGERRQKSFGPPDVGAALALLDAALADAGRQPTPRWCRDLAPALEALVVALGRETTCHGDDSLLSEIERSAPHVNGRIARLRKAYSEVLAAAVSLRNDARGGDVDPHRARDVAATLARRLRRARTDEADLIFEAVNRDIGGGD